MTDKYINTTDRLTSNTNMVSNVNFAKRKHTNYRSSRNVSTTQLTVSANGTRKSRKTRKRNKDHPGSISELPPIKNNPIQTRCMRYVGTITSSTEFRVADMTTILLAVTSGSTSAIKLFEAVLIRSVAITCLPAADTNAGTFAFTWVGEREPDTVETMFYSLGQPDRWVFKPPPGSLAGFWVTQDTSETTNSIFKLDPDNSTVKIILDLSFEYVMCDGASTTLTLSGAATFTGVAARVMPGSATDELVPVGINSVTS